MSILTPFFNLIKPAKTDPAAIAQINTDLDIIDTEMHKPPLTVNGVEPNPETRDLYLSEVPLAGNLASDIAQVSNGLYIERMAGGAASIEDGDASLTTVRGNLERNGYVAESLDMTVSPVEGSTITATIDRDTFVAYVPASGTITLIYTTAWSADPVDYGITVSGDPATGDTITVVYVKEERGTITTATPATFTSTGWNLYNNDTGYARVIAYSTQYGYKLGGTYNLIEFAETISGERSAISVIDGYFNVPSDGFVFVNGGDATTYIYATWSDWTDGYDGAFQTYRASTIDLTEAMLLFPYGLCAIGDVHDEINPNVARAIRRIDRTAYTETNLETIIASGVPYIYDTNYIYFVLETPVTDSIDVDGAYIVSDHGIEFYTGTTVPVYTETLYGENLKDKLRTDVLTISAQTLTAAQQTQARNNISAASQADIAALNGNLTALSNNLMNFVSLGRFSATGVNALTKIQDCINRVNTSNEYTTFCGIPQQSGASLVFGYLYPDKQYGGGIHITSASATFWLLADGQISLVG